MKMSFLSLCYSVPLPTHFWKPSSTPVKGGKASKQFLKHSWSSAGPYIQFLRCGQASKLSPEDPPVSGSTYLLFQAPTKEQLPLCGRYLLRL
jgi:hypothetical protein